MPRNNHEDDFNFWEYANPHRAPGSGVDHHPSAPFPFNSHGPWAAGPHHRHHGSRRGPFGPFNPWWMFDDEDEEQQTKHRKPKDGKASQQDDQTMTDDAEPSNSRNEKERSATVEEDCPDPAEVTPDEDAFHPPLYGAGSFWAPRGRHGRAGCRGRRRGHSRHHHAGGPPDMPAFIRGFANHPFFRHMGDAASRYRSAAQPSDDNSFSPPTDVFNTTSAYVLHFALPGAKKEDIGVSWDPERNVLRVSGVVHRLGDENFLRALHNGERRVGEFEREIELPPTGVSDKDDVDEEGITAKMEDGILIVTVPKIEKEWTEIRKVDIN